MAYIPDDLFEELNSRLSDLMESYHYRINGSDYECSFCLRWARTNHAPIEHKDDCLGMRLVRAMDAEKRSQLGSG